MDKEFVVISLDKYNDLYQANQESINSTKLKLRILENQYQREWGQARGTN